MIDKELPQVVYEFESVTEALMQLLDSFPDEEFNAVPFEGSWTAGQVGRHLYKSYRGVPKLIDGPVVDSNRHPEALVATFKEAFLDFDVKMQSPDFILPEPIHYNRIQLLQDISKVRLEIILKLKTHDLTKICTGFQLPGAGPMTRLEWVHFMVVHTRRHNHQLQKIRSSLVVSDPLLKSLK
ncbi:MAG TPA: DinB family protein [Chitinophagaceae bacterium]